MLLLVRSVCRTQETPEARVTFVVAGTLPTALPS